MDFLMGIVYVIGISVTGGLGYAFYAKWLEDHRGKVGKKDLKKIQADLDELKTQVSQIKEYMTDIYIQHYDQERAAKVMTTEAELYHDLKQESE